MLCYFCVIPTLTKDPTINLQGFDLYVYMILATFFVLKSPVTYFCTNLIFFALFSNSFFSSDDLETNDKHTLTIMKEMTAACRQNPSCLKLDPFDKVACIRRCVSPMCYNQIYDSSPLEPGEIDVKYPQYKSCFHKLWKSRYRESLNITQNSNKARIKVNNEKKGFFISNEYGRFC